MHKPNFERIKKSSFHKWGFVHNATDIGVGRVWVAWNPLTVNVQAMRFSKIMWSGGLIGKSFS